MNNQDRVTQTSDDFLRGEPNIGERLLGRGYILSVGSPSSSINTDMLKQASKANSVDVPAS